MSFEPIDWKAGDPITESRLRRMQEQIVENMNKIFDLTMLTNYINENLFNNNAQVNNTMNIIEDSVLKTRRSRSRDLFISADFNTRGKIYQTLYPEDFEVYLPGRKLVMSNGTIDTIVDADYDILVYRFPHFVHYIPQFNQSINYNSTVLCSIENITPGELTESNLVTLAYDYGLQGGWWFPIFNASTDKFLAYLFGINRKKVTPQTTEENDTTIYTLTPANFTLWQTPAVFWGGDGSVAQPGIYYNQENWSLYERVFPKPMTINIDSIVTDENNASGVYKAGYVDVDDNYNILPETGIIRAKSIFINKNTDNQYSMNSIHYSVVNDTTVNLVTDFMSEKYEYSIGSVSFSANVHNEFNNVIVCQQHLHEFTDIVAFGDSIFHGQTRVDGVGYPNGAYYSNGSLTEYQGTDGKAPEGVMYKFSELLNLPLTNYSVSGAFLIDYNISGEQSVYSQIHSWNFNQNGQEGTPRVPLVIFDGGTNDQSNLQLIAYGNYNSAGNDSRQICDAMRLILNRLINDYNLQPWQIVITTPIPKYIKGNSNWAIVADTQLTTIGLAMYQIGLEYGCNVINGYNSVFNFVEEERVKNALMEDDVHPTPLGATYYAHYLYDSLCGSSGKFALTT